MLQLYVYGTSEEGWMDIDANTKLSMEYFSDLFDDQFTNGQFSLPLDLPLTDNNRRKLGFAERLSNSNNIIKYWKVDIIDDGWPILTGAKMAIVQSSGNWGYTKGKLSVIITGAKGMFGSIIQNKKLTDLVLGGVIKWPVAESRQFATDHKNGLYPQFDYIVFAPIAIEDYIDTEQADYTTEFLIRDTVNDIVLKLISPGVYDIVFDRVDPTNSNAVIAPGLLQHIDYRTIPFFKLQYVFRKCFEEFGYTVSGDWIDDIDFAKLYLFNNFSLEIYSLTTYTDYNNMIIPSNHVPDMLIVDFIKAVCTFFNIYPTFDGSNNTVKINYRKNIIKTINSVCMTDKIVDDMEVTQSALSDSSSTPSTIAGTINQGFTLEYDWGNDSYYSDRVKAIVLKDGYTYIGDKVLVGSVQKPYDLTGFVTNIALTTSHCVLVRDQNMYYSVADATVIPILWEPYAEALNSYVYGDGSNTINLGMSTLCQYIMLNATTGLNYNYGILAAKMKGSYNTNKGNRITNPFGLKIFYADYATIPASGTPTAMSYNNLAGPYLYGVTDTSKLVKYDLALNSQLGIVKILHYEWQVLQQNLLLVKATLLMDTKVFNDLNTYNQLEINGVLFMVNKIELETPIKGTMVVYLVPM